MHDQSQVYVTRLDHVLGFLEQDGLLNWSEEKNDFLMKQAGSKFIMDLLTGRFLYNGTVYRFYRDRPSQPDSDFVPKELLSVTEEQ